MIRTTQLSDPENIIAMAGRTVADTYELLENILLFLPMKDIFKAKAVSQSWKALIECSKSLKRAMFLLCDASDCLQIDPTPDKWYEHRMMLKLKSTDPLAVVPLFTQVSAEVYNSNESATASEQRAGIFARYISMRGPRLYYQLYWTPEAARQALSYPQCRMYFTNPPITAVSIEYVRSEEPWDNGDFSRYCNVENPEGITVGELAETMVELAEEDGMDPFWAVQWRIVFQTRPADETS